MGYFSLIILVVNQAFGTSWIDLEFNHDFRLKQSFQLRQVERSRSIIDLQKGEKLRLNDIIGLDMIKVSLFKFSYPNCPGQEMKTAMDLVRVEESFVEVGSMIEKCHLELYIENKDIFTNSFFE